MPSYFFLQNEVESAVECEMTQTGWIIIVLSVRFRDPLSEQNLNLSITLVHFFFNSLSIELLGFFENEHYSLTKLLVWLLTFKPYSHMYCYSELFQTLPG